MPIKIKKSLKPLVIGWTK